MSLCQSDQVGVTRMTDEGLRPSGQEETMESGHGVLRTPSGSSKAD